jgi:hypothetical protein
MYGCRMWFNGFKLHYDIWILNNFHIVLTFNLTSWVILVCIEKKNTNKSIWNPIIIIILKLNYWISKNINVGIFQLNDDFNKEKYCDKLI